MRRDKILVGRIHGLLAGSERDDEISAGEKPVQPPFLGESEGDLSGGVRCDLVASVEAEVDSKPDLEEGTKAYLFALLARAGLQEATPDYDEKLADGISEFAQRRT